MRRVLNFVVALTMAARMRKKTVAALVSAGLAVAASPASAADVVDASRSNGARIQQSTCFDSRPSNQDFY